MRQMLVFFGLGLILSYSLAIALGIRAITHGGIPATTSTYNSEAGLNSRSTERMLGYTQLTLKKFTPRATWPLHGEDQYLGLWEEVHGPFEPIPLPWWADGSHTNGVQNSAVYRAVGFPLRMLIHQRTPDDPSIWVSPRSKHKLATARQAAEKAEFPVGIVAPSEGMHLTIISPRLRRVPILKDAPTFTFSSWSVLHVRGGEAFLYRYTRNILVAVYKEITLIPHPVAWVVNAMVFTVPLLLLYFLPFRFRRNLRIRTGRCVRCKYDLSGLDTGDPCPECGRNPLSGRPIADL
ncbi:MAG: hypothetical protein ACF8Q5_15260 [Phycisphaerales bacterium JB040]